MNQTAQPAARSPGRLFCALLAPVLRVYLRCKYGFRRERISLPAGPFVVLGNHASNLDFLFAYATIFPRRPNALVSRFFFGERALGWLLRTLRCIPRDQFLPDPASIRTMVRIVRQGGGVLLYPEGEVNGTGRFVRMPPGVGRLCKLLDAPVYTAVTHGSYLSRPKWAARERKGQVSCHFAPLLTREALKALSPAEVEARVREGLFYDDYAWEATAQIPFRARGLAEGLESLLYHCPCCGAEFCLQSEGDLLRCTNCENTLRLDEYGYLHPAGPKDSLPFAHPGAWVDAQRALCGAAVAAPDFALTAPGTLLLHRDERQLGGAVAGRGVIRLDRESIGYDGTRNGEQVSLRYALRDFYKTPFNMKVSMEIPGTNPRVSFAPGPVGMVMKFILMMEAIGGRVTLCHSERSEES